MHDPHGMSWTTLAEQRINEAMASGEWAALPGKGKPIDYTTYFASPADTRAGNAVLLNANVTPPEVDWLRQQHTLRESLTKAPESERRAMREELQTLETNYQIHRERRLLKRRS